MAWERHVAKVFLHLSPVDFTRSDNWLLGITLVMAQVLKKHQKLTVQVVTEVVGDFIINKWKRQGICLWQEDFFLDTSLQNWMGRSQLSQMPPQESFHNNFQTALACGHYSVLSSIYADRNWKLDFDQREHIAGARRWMATVGQVAGEAAILEFCGICTDSYTKWTHRPRPQCDCDSREQVHVQSCAPVPLFCLHFGLNTYSQNQAQNDSQREEASNFEDTESTKRQGRG